MNTTAIRLYERLGFSGRSRTVMVDELRAQTGEVRTVTDEVRT